MLIETTTCQAVQVRFGSQAGGGSRTITVVDTPGFNDTTRPDGEILAEISEFLAAQRGSNVPLRGILFLHKITENKITGSDETYLSLLESLVGEAAMSNLILVTTMWNKMRDEDKGEGMQREQDLIDNYWEPLIAKGAYVAQFDGTRKSALSFVSHLSGKQGVVLKIQKEVWDEERAIIGTSAGRRLWQQLTKKRAKMQDRLSDVDKQMGEGQTGLQSERDKVGGVLSRIAQSFTRMSERPGPGLKKRMADMLAGDGATAQGIRVLITIFNIALFVASAAA